MIRRDASRTIALVNGEEPVMVAASGELPAQEPFDEAWFRRRVLELLYDVGELKAKVAALEGDRA